MRVIEAKMLQAIKDKRFFSLDNTMIHYSEATNTLPEKSEVYLHGNHIATYYHGQGVTVVNKYTLKKWSTPTTKSRLRALGVNITTRRRVTYLDNEAI